MKKVIIFLIVSMLFSCAKKVNVNIENADALNFNGPNEKNELIEVKKASWKEYSNGPSNSIAVLLTDEDSSWLGIVRGFKSMGIPFVVLKEIDAALSHDIVMVYPYISGKVLSEPDINKLKNYTEKGGTMMAVNVLGGGMQETFGFQKIEASKKHLSLNFKNSEYTEEFDHPREKEVLFNRKDLSTSVIGSNTYTKISGKVIAEYEDGSAAIFKNSYGEGTAIAIGLDIGFFIQKSYNSRTDGGYRDYINSFEPGSDMILRLIKNIYLEHESFPVVLSTTPLDFPLAVMITHDVDYSESYQNSIIYAELEKKHNVRATYYIQTKYLKDFQDVGLLNSETIDSIKKIYSMGMEIASHSVSHSYTFAKFDTGAGDEKFPQYSPIILNEEETTGASVFGELRVSKFLLEQIAKGSDVVSFRPGFLSYPFSLPEVLESTGYKYSSSISANSAMTHLPFKLNYGRGYDAQVNVYEFPIAIEDEKPPLMNERVDEALETAALIAEYGGIFNILIHPNVLDHKYEFQKVFIEKTRDKYWYGSVSDFGKWWSARDSIEMKIATDGNEIRIDLFSKNKFYDISLTIPKGYKLKQNTSDKVILQGSKVIIQGTYDSISIVLEKM